MSLGLGRGGMRASGEVGAAHSGMGVLMVLECHGGEERSRKRREGE